MMGIISTNRSYISFKSSYSWFPDISDDNPFKLTWIPTTEMVADILTKVSPAPTFIRLRSLLNAQSLPVFQNGTKEAVGIDPSLDYIND